jgi:hypothetical protein
MECALVLSRADESVDRAVEPAGQLFRLRILRVQDALEPEAIHQGDNLVDQPVQVDLGWQLRRGEYPLQKCACLLVHEECAGLSDLRQLRLEGELVSGRLSVQRRSGTLAATHRSPLAQLSDLAALGRAASANRTRIESWKTRHSASNLGPGLEDPAR